MAENPSVTFKPTLRDVRGRFTKATEKLVENKRKASRVLARRWVAIAREEAPLGKTGKFRKSIRYTEFEDKTKVGFSSTSAQPLGTFIVAGTKPHKIYPRRAGALYFLWTKIGKYTVVPKGGGFKTHTANGKLWIGKGFVQHPGTSPNNYVERSYVRWVKEMDKEIIAVADRFVIDVVGNK